MKTRIAEVISLGDELVSGQRLDTNSQWISQQLNELGVPTAFHSTVGDNFEQSLQVFETAVQRADIVVTTGGLGPTADDLTREIIARVARVTLERDPEVVSHIRQMYSRRKVQMPESNLVQADFPAGATVIHNPEGTAPGIDFIFSPDHEHSGECRVFSLPGVPAEMKQMWLLHVKPALKELLGSPAVIMHRTLHIFGEGESKIESMLPDLVRRGKDPTTGITASAATITLRVSTAGANETECQQKIEPVLQTITQTLGDLVFGSDGQTLADVVIDLLKKRGQTVAVVDAGLHGEVASALAMADHDRTALRNAILPASNLFSTNPETADKSDSNIQSQSMSLLGWAKRVRQENDADFGIAIGSVDRDPAMIESGKSVFRVLIACPETGGQSSVSEKEYVFRGHSSWRQQRAVKQVLNQLRLLLNQRD
jgi:nicotinamide-nucleotide amidase